MEKIFRKIVENKSSLLIGGLLFWVITFLLCNDFLFDTSNVNRDIIKAIEMITFIGGLIFVPYGIYVITKKD
jgi:hypothetical protein